MRKNSNLSAFTLFELLMVMILISIVVTVLGATLYNVGSFHKRLKDRVEQVGSFKEVKYVIYRDFNRMKFYEASSTELIFTDGIDTVFYSFGEKIVRQQGIRVDSLLVTGGLTLTDSTATIMLLLGERKTSIRLPSISSGVLAYRASDSGETEKENE